MHYEIMLPWLILVPLIGAVALLLECRQPNSRWRRGWPLGFR